MPRAVWRSSARTTFAIAFTCLVGLGTVCERAAAADARTLTSALESIQGRELQQHVNVLASDTFEGRESGSRGGRASAAYVVGELKKLKLTPQGVAGTYFQEFGAGYRNILGVIPGSDPQLSREYILIGAHYDHVGYGTSQNSFGPTGRIHNGADDNASGVSSLLELIEACALLPTQPRRSLLFVFWDAEERGLLGSKHWVQHPTVPLHSVRLALNVDMVGRLRDETLEVYGSRTVADLRRLVSESNRAADLNIDFRWDNTNDSDHYPFFSNSIPYLMLHTRKHDDYHRPSDDADKLNIDGLQNLSRLMFQLILAAADAPDWASFRDASRGESDEQRQQRVFQLPSPAPRLGVSWDKDAAADGTIRLSVVAPSSAAAKADLRVGDELVEFAGRPLDGSYDFRTHVLAAENPVSVTLRRDGELVETVVNLEGRPARIGVSWRLDDAEPTCVILRQVIPGSPADIAGLRLGDRIYLDREQGIDSSQQFADWITSQTGTFDLLTERGGRIRTVRVRLLTALDDAP